MIFDYSVEEDCWSWERTSSSSFYHTSHCRIHLFSAHLWCFLLMKMEFRGFNISHNVSRVGLHDRPKCYKKLSPKTLDCSFLLILTAVARHSSIFSLLFNSSSFSLLLSVLTLVQANQALKHMNTLRCLGFESVKPNLRLGNWGLLGFSKIIIFKMNCTVLKINGENLRWTNYKMIRLTDNVAGPFSTSCSPQTELPSLSPLSLRL